MSNASLIERIREVLAAVRDGSLSATKAAVALRNNGRALEGMPYALITELESIAMDLDVAFWHDQSEFLTPDLATTLERVEEWVARVPLDV